MRLFELSSGSEIKISTDAYPCGEVFTLLRIDGSYAICVSTQTTSPASTVLRGSSEEKEVLVYPKAFSKIERIGNYWELTDDRCPTPDLPRAIVINR